MIQKGTKPNNIHLDNEAIKEHLSMSKDQGLGVHLVLPFDFRKKLAEITIWACTNHLMACISNADPYFPMMLWYALIA